MKIIEPFVELEKIERCGRVCHQSEPKGKPEDFVRKLIKLGHESVLEHVNLTFHIVCDRAIQNELVRHRLASFSVESTRYVKYDEIEVVSALPRNDERYFTNGDIRASYEIWYLSMLQIEECYKALLQNAFKPEEARAVLPLCLKSELYMTANLREWRHILRVRTSEHAHPQMRFIAGKILGIFKEKLPVIVEDF